MHYYDYVPHRFSAASVELINVADEIIRDYADQGYDLTLRQLYYQWDDVVDFLRSNDDE